MPISIQRPLAILCASLCFAVLAAPPACATSATDLRAEQLLMGANFLKESLTLTPNQLILWQQTASRSATLLRTRQSRREKMQAALKVLLADPAADPRKAAVQLDEENGRIVDEEKQLREWWLTVADALDDRQRALAAQYILTQLERVDQPERAARPEREQGGPAGGGRRKQSGGQGGMGGSPGNNASGSVRF